MTKTVIASPGTDWRWLPCILAQWQSYMFWDNLFKIR